MRSIFAVRMKLSCRHHTLLCLLLLALLPGCKDEAPATASDPAATDLNEALLGTWETVEVETTTHSTNGVPDSTIYLAIREADWGRKYGSRPARTIFNPDGKFTRTYYNVNGDVTDLTHGLWKLKGSDSLLVIEPNTVLHYKHELDGSLLTLTGQVDWDYDKAQDDDYRAVLRLVSRTVE